MALTPHSAVCLLPDLKSFLTSLSCKIRQQGIPHGMSVKIIYSRQRVSTKRPGIIDKKVPIPQNINDTETLLT